MQLDLQSLLAVEVLLGVNIQVLGVSECGEQCIRLTTKLF